MTKTAFLFAGQGAQTLGMARDLYEHFEIIKETFDQASQVLGYDIRSLIDDNQDKLNQTRYTQPAILTTSVAIYRLLMEKGISPDIVAGLSLGEYSALVAAGGLDFETALRVVAKRGQLMEEAAPTGIGKMVAIMNTDVSLIEDACQKASDLGVVSPANYNTPQQIVIGGEIAAVDKVLAILKEAGVKRMIPLQVSGPFHTALLQKASQGLAQVLEKVTFNDFKIPLVGNTEAKMMKKDDVKSLLARQVMEPVRFYESIAEIQAFGVDRVIEIGPGKVLSGFIKKIDKSLPTISVNDLASLEQLLNQISEEKNGN
ncbi:ACP S-malonyltransferase [Streptococcus thoraltensis]|uniref:ACP S-malonyltransferase n=1 Tax=Streptococcus thoraltensis TaxID=55085 RepID=UPI000382C344|nr:ACP S-malonyltransferase [Streptococcus thoraltensis]MDY4760806.1 ACP S-malonyltransferase [Streptococcus thoraltensis]